MSQLYTDSFCDRLAWVHRNSQGMGLKRLDRYHQRELLKAISSASQGGTGGFTEFEIEVLSLAVSYCCYFQNEQPVPFSRFKGLKKTAHFYQEMEKLAKTGQSIGCCAARLSFLVRDDQMGGILQSME